MAKDLVMPIIGRLPERQRIKEIIDDKKSAFIAVYGRRRVGKTYLIKEYFNNNFTFFATGLANSTTEMQLVSFTVFLNESFQTSYAPPPNWFQAFVILKTELSKVKGKKVIFIDELPWFDTKKSDFMTGLDFFWNSWASDQKDLKLFVCGSAASWMINELIRNKGGLYNRVTHRFKIEPFTLQETEMFLQSKNINLDRYQVLNLYMVMGGIPYYLEQIKKGLTATQNIEEMCFSNTGLLRNEFQFIFSSLFNNSEKHEKLLRTVHELGNRATRENLILAMKTVSNGDFSIKLNELEESGFLKSYTPIGVNKMKRVYVIADYYTLFYYKFIENAGKFEKGTWTKRLNNSATNVWAGLTFEQVCWDHTLNIKKSLGIDGIYSETSSWQKPADLEGNGAQIDLIIDRKDRVINLFEIKFSVNQFEITKEYDMKLRNKIGAFQLNTRTRKTIFLSMITTFGLVDNMYRHSVVQNSLTLDDLFFIR